MSKDRRIMKYFSKMEGMYPRNVLEKPIICVGLGGIRSYLENMARNGFVNFVLIDGDKISPTNISTQGVFISEMGKYKGDAIKERIMDINPASNVICVNRFLDATFSDEEFENYLRMFPDKKTTDFLVLGCTDDFGAQMRVSALALKFGIPYIGASVYRKGLGAEVIFTYPGVTAACPRCMLRSRYEYYENGGNTSATSAFCSCFNTERLNSTIGQISLMILMYKEDENSPYSTMLDGVKDRNFVWIRNTPYLKDSEIGIKLFDTIFNGSKAERYTYTDETIWLPQRPDEKENGEPCKLCGGIGNLKNLYMKWSDTRKIVS